MTGAPPQPTMMIDQLVAAERTRVLYSGIKTAAITGPIGVAVLALLFWQTVDHWRVLVWAISSAIVICPASLVLLANFQRNNRLPDDAPYWLRLAVLRYFIISIAFGSAGAALFVADSASGQMMLFCYLAALSSTLTAETAQHPWIYATSLPALLAPFILRAALEDDRTAAILAILAAAALVFVLLTARSLGRMIHESLLMRFKNQELVAQLQIQKQLAEQSRDEADRARVSSDEAGARAESARLEAVEANRAKSRFLAAASHDLRQPIHALGLFASALRSHVAGEEGLRIVDKIISSVGSTEVLFNALLDVSRLDAGILEPDIKPFAVASLLDRLVDEYAPRAQSKGLSLRLRSTRHIVTSDPTLLERVIRNYLGNAIRYTHRGGMLLGCRRRGNALRIELWDTGQGIPNDKLDDVYKEFYQLGNPERNRANGLGLGLAIVRRVARLLGHPIGVVSKVGRGSRFSIEVPLARTEEAQGNAIDQVSVWDENVLIGACVLVIDDEPEICEAIEALLKQWGCRVVAVDSSGLALEALRKQDLLPDVILSDYRLRAGQSGIEAIQAITREFGAIPAALITGDTASDSLKEAAISHHELMHKPLNPMRLKSVLCRMLQRGIAPLPHQ